MIYLFWFAAIMENKITNVEELTHSRKPTPLQYATWTSYYLTRLQFDLILRTPKQYTVPLMCKTKQHWRTNTNKMENTTIWPQGYRHLQINKQGLRNDCPVSLHLIDVDTFLYTKPLTITHTKTVTLHHRYRGLLVPSKWPCTLYHVL